MTSILGIQAFYNPSIADNFAQVEAICAIFSKRSGLAPVCFYISNNMFCSVLMEITMTMQGNAIQVKVSPLDLHACE